MAILAHILVNFPANLSASEIFDLIRPVITVVSALVSTCVLVSAQKRYALYQAFAWAIATFFFPLIALPLYLTCNLFWKRHLKKRNGKRFAIGALYLATTLIIFGSYTYVESHTVDACLSRAAFAKVSSDYKRAIAEYRQALKLEDTPHNHKLLAEALQDAGEYKEAITEFRAAESGGEPDDGIHLHLGILLDKENQKEPAIVEFERYANSKTCLQLDNWCDEARQRIAKARQQK